MNAAALPLAAVLCACLALYAVRVDHDGRRRAGLLLGRPRRPARPGPRRAARLAAALAALVRGAPQEAREAPKAEDWREEGPPAVGGSGRERRPAPGTVRGGARARVARDRDAEGARRAAASRGEALHSAQDPRTVRPDLGRPGPSKWAAPAPGQREAPGVRLAGRVRRGGPGWPALAAGTVLGVVTHSPVPVLAGLVAVPLLGRLIERRAARAGAEHAAAAVAALCAALAADLRAGRPPHAALADAVETAGWPGSARLGGAARLLLSATRFGGDVPQALRAAARRQEGLHGLAAVAACWQVAVDGGAGLAAALDRVAGALRAEADQREDLRAQLAGPRSTAVLLALLPVFGLVLGAGLGADPSAMLLHTPAGLVCLVSGVLLECAGLAWTGRIIRAAEGRPS